MALALTTYPAYLAGLFVRIRPDHPRKDRASKDGFVHRDAGQEVILSFGHNRHLQYQGIPTSLPEVWAKSDTQFESLGLF